MKKNILGKFIIVFSFILLFTRIVWAEDLITEIVPPETLDEEIIDITTPSDINLTPEVLNIFIRNNDKVIYDAGLNLPEDGVVGIIDNNGENHEINSRSVLAILKIISESENSSFVISDLQYYSSMNALYLKCITPTNDDELCDNWQYVVDGVTPWTGIDQTILHEGESIGLYFGTPHKLNLDKNEVEEGQSVSVKALKYNYVDNIWEILSGVNISVTTPNDSDPWSPVIISETSVDENGEVVISLENEGIYTFGIKEDYSFPSYQVVVKKHISSGGGSNPEVFSLPSAINFLETNKDNGTLFGDDLYNDWVAIGISKMGDEASILKEELFNYFKNTNFESLITTDNERHAMALMSLGIDPRIGTGVNYINKIISSFDGTQIGDRSLYSDDIFGLIVLSHAGYTKNDQIIQKIISYVISKQESNGSWDSVDMTSAAIQGLRNFEASSEAIEKGENYLLSQQESDGSFGNSFSTSWAIQALSFNNSFDLEIEKAITYLDRQQKEDGGLGEGDISLRIWATAYAIPSILKFSWNDILESFDQEENEVIAQEEEPIEVIIKKEIIIDEKKEEKIDIEIVEKNIIKKTKIIEDEKKIPLEEIDRNVLSASAIDSGIDFDSFWSSVMTIVSRIKMSLIWLFVHFYI